MAPVLVTGGTGTLGSAVVAELTARGQTARVLSRGGPRPDQDPDVPTVRGDLRTGVGLVAALTGVDAVIHCATYLPRAWAVDVEGTRRLLEQVAITAPQAHMVHVSIVGCRDNPLRYYLAKTVAEDLVTTAAATGVRASIVRATQFHQLLRLASRVPGRGPVALAFRMRMQPCDPVFVARHLVDVAAGEPRADVLEVAGPEVIAMPDAIRMTARAEGRREPRVLELPPVGGALRGFARGSNIPGPDAVTGGLTYGEWLERRGAPRT